MTVLSACYMGREEWEIYDKYRIFAVGQKQQIKYFLIAFTLSIPNGIIEYNDTIIYLDFINLDEHPYFVIAKVLKNPLQDYGFAAQIVIIFLRIGFLLTSAIRCRPLLNLIYAASCVRDHLKKINSILVQERKSNSSRSNSNSIFTNNIENSINFETRTGNKLPEINLTIKSYSAGDNQRSAFVFSECQLQSNSPTKLRRQRNFTQLLIDDHIQQDDSSNYQETSNHELLTTINNLRQLEVHVAQLNFFVYDLDHCSAFLVLSLCLLSLLSFTHGLFFMIEIYDSYLALILGIIYCTSRLLIPFFLFITGDNMEKEIKSLLSEIELYYLQDTTQSLIYKQYNNVTANLARIINHLNLTKFNCEKLMDINKSTMINFFIITASAVFIVTQYGESS